MDPVLKFTSLGINERLAANLVSNGFHSFFEIQELVIPKLLQNNSRRCIEPRHICASAPTGSGKTLAYVVPLLQAVQRNSFAEIRLKAIVILPTRELATQVYEVFQQLSVGLNVSIGIATGQTSFEHEQRNLIGDDSPIDERFGCSQVDILVCTPGRLQDHLLMTPHFTLQHLRFIVLDEADRLLGNAYHHWVKALVQSSAGSDTHGLDSLLGVSSPNHHQHGATHRAHNYHQYGAESVVGNNHMLGCLPPSFLHSGAQRSVQRLLFSATLSDNPAKLALLGVKNPLVFRVGGVSQQEPVIDDPALHEPQGAVPGEDGEANGEDSDQEPQNNSSTPIGGLAEVSRISQQVARANEKILAQSADANVNASEKG